MILEEKSRAHAIIHSRENTIISYRPFDIVYNDDGHGTLVRVVEDLQQHGAALGVVESDHGIRAQQSREGEAAVGRHLC